MFALYMISQYLKIKNDPKKTVVPRTYIVSGKAAPGYAMAKLIIKFINSIADVVNSDSAVNDKMKVVFLENYRVSLAEKIFPASDLSEQISTAGTEASGTGCMKFMMNGALTIGTYDGANIEMAEAVGEENIFMFGKKVNEVEALQRQGYNPQEYINNSPVLRDVIQLVQNNFFCPMDHGLFNPLLETITYGDRYFLAADFEQYLAMQEKMSALYKDKNAWLDKAITNVARSGVFSSDRTIREYCKDIWDVKA